ncbi:Trissin, partial [Frankliniella fusca]
VYSDFFFSEVPFGTSSSSAGGDTGAIPPSAQSAEWNPAMLNFGPLALLTSGLLLCFLVAPLAAQSCTSCGPECVSACGSRRYRTCCFNYLRKRRSPGAPGAPAAEMADIGGVPLQLQVSGAGDGLGLGLGLAPDDARLQFVLVPSDRLEEAQEAAGAGPLLGAQSLLRRLLDGQQPLDNEVGGGGAGGGSGGSSGGSSAGSSAETTSAPASATLQRHRAGGGAA